MVLCINIQRGERRRKKTDLCINIRKMRGRKEDKEEYDFVCKYIPEEK